MKIKLYIINIKNWLKARFYKTTIVIKNEPLDDVNDKEPKLTQDMLDPLLDVGEAVEKPQMAIVVEEDVADDDGVKEKELEQTMAQAAAQAVAVSRDQPHQSQILFDDKEVLSWDEIVEKSLQQRLGKNYTKAKKQEEKQVKEVLEPEDMIVFYVMAGSGKKFYGYDISDIFKELSLIYGEHKIFHKIDSQYGRLFSVASAVNPGSFNLQMMHLFASSGLVFFMDIKNTAKPKVAFRTLLASVYEVAKYLGGNILNGEQKPLTQSGVENSWAKVKRFCQ